METGYQTCYRHPDHQAGVICQRCDRPICPQCMHQASVGFHCPECTKKGAQKVYQGVGSLRVKPVLTQILIAINVGIFLLGLASAGSAGLEGDVSQFQTDFGLTAKLWDLNGRLYNGPIPGSTMIGVGAGEWYRIVTSGFLHFGLLHIALNMWALWVLGQAVEQIGGRIRFGLIYGLALLGGSVTALVLEPQGITAGASGAIYGLMGALLLAQRAAGIPFRNSPLLMVLGINLLLTFGISGISIGGHIGGLVLGSFAGWLLFDVGRRPNIDQRMLYGACVLLGIALFVGGGLWATSFQPTF